MKKILCIGEALIDFIATESGFEVKDVASFMPKVGGAPLNVCGAAAKLGNPAGMITMLGYDQFGDKIIEYLKENNISTEYLYRTTEASTSLAFVSKLSNGDSNYTFFRNPLKYGFSKELGINLFVVNFIFITPKNYRNSLFQINFSYMKKARRFLPYEFFLINLPNTIRFHFSHLF